MRKTIATITQILIFIGAYFVMTPDQVVDNTHLFGLFGDVEITKGNTDWVMLAAMLVSIINILIWWPKVKITNTSNEKPIAAEGTKSTEAKDPDPVVPKMD